MSVFRKEFSLRNEQNLEIKCKLFAPKTKSNCPLVLLAHGFKSYKDWGFIPYLGESFANVGIMAVSFDFSLNGIVDPDKMIYDTDRFSRNTVSQEIADIKSIIDYITSDECKIFDELVSNWNGELIIFGHSLGGAVSLLSAKNDNRISKLIMWAAVSRMDRYTERQKNLWREQGYLEFKISATKQNMRLNVTYLEDKENFDKEFNLLEAAKKISIPTLLVHGTQDISVRIFEAEEYIEAFDKNYLTSVIIENTGHSFGVDHKFKKSNARLEQAIEETIKFIKEN